ncbi:TraB family protein [Candidatus Woesearchaeota archaeon]|nr:TraB family protein [Candidatus Woesearchaeota archaeon]
MRYKNLTVIGTSHIAKQSLKEVESTITKQKPDIIALELDQKRFIALTQEKQRKLRLKDIKRIGFKGLLFNLIGAWIEQKLGKLVGVKPGSEMIQAIKLAKKYKKNIALIDQDIEITLRRISSSLTWKEKFNFIVDILKGIFFKKSELKKLGIDKIDLTKVPTQKVVDKIIKEVKKRYPNFYRVLIEERNQIMASNLYELMSLNQDKKILAIVGAGHEKDIIKIIKNLKPAKQEISYSFNIK